MGVFDLKFLHWRREWKDFSMNEFEFEKINIYCDESCHLRNKDSDVMVLGAIWICKKDIDSFKKKIRKIKRKI